jgi:bacillithiol system protein YtxJ
VEYLKNVEMWERVLETRDRNREFLLLKLSPICRTSRIVERVFDQWYQSLPEGLGPVAYKLDVVAARELSQHVAHQLEVRHQSPQAIWLDQDLNVRWHGSHHGITEKRLTAQLQTTETEGA